MTATCPSCESPDVRIHGSLCRVAFRRRWWLFGTSVPRIRTVALECSCGKCLYAFVARADGTRPAPRQDAYDQLRSARDAVASKDGEEKRKVVPLPRPAPDPRARKPK